MKFILVDWSYRSGMGASRLKRGKGTGDTQPYVIISSLRQHQGAVLHCATPPTTTIISVTLTCALSPVLIKSIVDITGTLTETLLNGQPP